MVRLKFGEVMVPLAWSVISRLQEGRAFSFSSSLLLLLLLEADSLWLDTVLRLMILIIENMCQTEANELKLI